MGMGIQRGFMDGLISGFVFQGGRSCGDWW